MNYQKTLIFLAFLVLANLSFSQKYNQDLMKSYSKNELTSMSDETLSTLDYAIGKACYLTPIPVGKDIGKFPKIEIAGDEKTIRFIDLGLKIQDTTQYFQVVGKDKILVVKSMYVLTLEKNKPKN
jgi:hypothetical protein